MNLVQIHLGEDYAWFEWKGRGETFRFGAKRVKIIRKFKQQHTGNTKESGYCEVFLLDDEGEFILDSNQEPRTREVRSRDIAMIWDEYEDERDRQQVIRDKQEAERKARWEEEERRYQERIAQQRKEREEREERETLEREERERIKREAEQPIYDWLAARGIRENGTDKVRIQITDQYVQILIKREGVH